MIPLSFRGLEFLNDIFEAPEYLSKIIKPLFSVNVNIHIQNNDV